MILDRIPILLDSHFMVNIVAGHRILIAQSVPCPALLWPMLCFLITELAKTELWSVIKALVQTSVKLCHKKKHKLCRQNKRRQEILWVNFLCGLYCSLYRNINPSHFEFCCDTLLILAKSRTKLKSGVLFGSKSCGIQQHSYLLLSVTPTGAGRFSILLILIFTQDWHGADGIWGFWDFQQEFFVVWFWQNELSFQIWETPFPWPVVADTDTPQ